MRTGWSSLRNKLFITLFEQKKQHLWHSCCPISLVISNMKFNRKLSEQFWSIWCFPIQSDRSCSWMPERRFKDGRRVTGLVLKRLCFNTCRGLFFMSAGWNEPNNVIFSPWNNFSSCLINLAGVSWNVHEGYQRNTYVEPFIQLKMRSAIQCDSH